MRFRCDVRPALQFEQLLETMFALDRRQDEQEGMPSPLRLAVIARAHFDVVRLPFPPAFVQRIGPRSAHRWSRLFGYRPTYDGALSVPERGGTASSHAGSPLAARRTASAGLGEGRRLAAVLPPSGFTPGEEGQELPLIGSEVRHRYRSRRQAAHVSSRRRLAVESASSQRRDHVPTWLWIAIVVLIVVAIFGYRRRAR